MCNTANRTAEGARAIIEENIQILYHLPEKYRYTRIMLQSVRKELLKILQYIKNIEPIIWKQKYTWYLDNGSLTTKVRKKTTFSVSNRHFNYLCCLGLLQKLQQTRESMIGINMEFLLETGQNRPMNVFSVFRYTEQQLDRIEERARMMYEKKVSAGNISRDKLVAAGLQELAKEVYYANTDKALTRKEEEWQRILRILENQCDTDGFSTKGEWCAAAGLSIDVLNELLKVFRLQFDEKYSYKAPNKEDKQRYHIAAESQKWIITKKERT